MIQKQLTSIFNDEYRESQFPYGKEESILCRIVNKQRDKMWREKQKKHKGKLKILDIGGGSGRDAASLADEAGVKSVMVLDISKVAIEAGKKCYTDSKLKFECGDALADSNGSFTEATYDIIYSHQFLHFVPTDELDKLLRSVFASLTQGGWTCHAFLAEQSKEMGRPYKKEENLVFSHLSESIKPKFEKAGLENIIVDRLLVPEYHHGKYHSHDVYVISGNKGVSA